MRDSKGALLRRLKLIEGQIRGLQRMLEEDEDCKDIIVQLCAAKKALGKVAFMMLCHKMQECMGKAGESDNPEAALEETMKLFLTLA